jgi:putative ATP-dependent endonuclease of the OLD family
VRIKSITVAGFRSFGPKPVPIRLAGELTAIVGPNASGKTALLQAFAKMFGLTRAQRALYRSDFHLPPEVPPDDRTTRELFIDVVCNRSRIVSRKRRASASCWKPTIKSSA